MVVTSHGQAWVGLVGASLLLAGSAPSESRLVDHVYRPHHLLQSPARSNFAQPGSKFPLRSAVDPVAISDPDHNMLILARPPKPNFSPRC